MPVEFMRWCLSFLIGASELAAQVPPTRSKSRSTAEQGFVFFCILFHSPLAQLQRQYGDGSMASHDRDDGDFCTL